MCICLVDPLPFTTLMDFKFNFCVDEGSDKEEEVISTSDQNLPSTSSPDSAPVSRQIPVLQAHWDTVRNTTPTEYSIPNSRSKLRYISGTQCNSINSGSSNSGMELKSLLALTDSEHSDLIPGTYEGGLKVWECSLLIRIGIRLHREERSGTGMWGWPSRRFCSNKRCEECSLSRLQPGGH